MNNLFQRFIPKHTFGKDERILKYKIEILVVITLLVSTIIMLFAMIRFFEGNYKLAAIDAVFSLIALVLLFYLHKNKAYYTLTSRLFLLFGLFIMFANFFMAVETYTRVLWFSSYMLLAFFLRDKKEGFVWLGIILAAVSVIAVVEPRYGLEPVNYMTLIANLILVATIVYWYEKVKENDRAELKSLNESLQVRIDEAVLENQKHERMLIQQSKMAAMGEMLESIAHQWRQPLNILGLSLTKMEMEQKLGIAGQQSFDEQFRVMNKQVQYMSQTIDDFRSFYQKDKHAVTISVKEMIDEIEVLMTPLLQSKSITLHNRCDLDIKITTYPNELKQVLLNLLNNAKDALMASASDHKVIEVSVEETPETVSIRIVDNAKGIDPKIIDRIFEPYFTTKFESKGTGIGLYMSKIIVEEHMQGSIHAENRQEEGALFVVILPKQIGE